MGKEIQVGDAAEALGDESSHLVSEDAFLRELISKQDLDDRSLWSEPINDDPLKVFKRILDDPARTSESTAS